METQMPPAHGHIYGDDHVNGRRDQEEMHHEKQPVLTKVKEKMKKIKETFTHKMHDHGVDEHVEDNPDVHGVPPARNLPSGKHDNLGQERVDLGKISRNFEEDLVAPKQKSEALIGNDQTQIRYPSSIGGKEGNSGRENVDLGKISGTDKEDHATPEDKPDAFTGGDQTQLHYPSSKGGEEGSSGRESVDLGKISRTVKEDPTAPEDKPDAFTGGDQTRLHDSSSKALYETTAVQNLPTGQHENPGQNRVDSGKISGNFEEDLAAQKQKSEAFTGSDQTQIPYPSSIGGEEGNSGRESVDLGKISGTDKEDHAVPADIPDVFTGGDQNGLQYPSSKALYETTSVQNLATSQHENPGQNSVDSEKISGNFEEDFAALKRKSEAFTGSDQTQIPYPSSIGGEEENSGRESVDLGKISGTDKEDPAAPVDIPNAFTRGDLNGLHYPSSKAMYETITAQNLATGQHENTSQKRVDSGKISGNFEDDYVPLKQKSETFTGSDQTQIPYPSSIGGEEENSGREMVDLGEISGTDKEDQAAPEDKPDAFTGGDQTRLPYPSSKEGNSGRESVDLGKNTGMDKEDPAAPGDKPDAFTEGDQNGLHYPSSKAPYETTMAQTSATTQLENPHQNRVDSGKISGNFEEDPAALKQNSEAFIGSDQTQIRDPSSIGGEEGNSGRESVDLGKISGTDKEDLVAPEDKPDAFTEGDETRLNYPSSEAPYETTTTQTSATAQLENPRQNRVDSGKISENFEEDPVALKQKSEAFTGSDQNQIRYPSSTGGEEGNSETVDLGKISGTVDEDPDAFTVGDQTQLQYPSSKGIQSGGVKPVSQSLENMTISDQLEGEKGEEEHHDQFSPDKPQTKPSPQEEPKSYTEKIKGVVASYFGGGGGSSALPVSNNHPKESAEESL